MTRWRPPSYTPEGLAKRLRDMERQIADLHRSGGAESTPARIESNGGPTEGFRAWTDFSSPPTFAAAATGYLPFQWALGSGTFNTPGVSGFDTAGSSLTVLAGGIWDIHFSARIVTAVVPTAGYLEFSVAAGSYESSAILVPYSDTYAQDTTKHFSDRCLLEVGDVLRVYCSNQLNQSVSISPATFAGAL